MSTRPDPSLVGSGEPVRPRWWSALTGPRARMVGVVGLSLLNTALAVLVSLRQSPSGVFGLQAPVPVAVAVAVIAPFLLLWRRRAAVPVLVLTVAAFLVSGVMVLPVGFALLTVAIQRRDLILVFCTAGVAVAFWTSPGSSTWWADGALSVVFAAFWALWGSYVGARRDLLQSLRDRARRAEEEQLVRADQARQTERARIAREMHDVVAHKVSLIALQAGGLEVNAQLAPDRVAGTAAQIRTTAREALEDLRSVLGVLRAGETDDGAGAELLPQPGLDDVPTLVDRSRAAGLAVTLVRESDDDVGPVFAVAPAAGRTAYRIVQEALTNVTKHARGATTTVSIGHRASAPATEAAIDGPVVTVSVVNRRPVASGTLLPGSGAGLIGLRERVELVGGVLDTGPTGDGGWAVRAVLPAAAGDAIGTAPAGPGVVRGGRG
ncbi:sensor histidine kinase [Nakamurella flava]|nr:histidine kinase [Nakamurella flava]